MGDSVARGATLEEISGHRHAGGTQLHCNRRQWTSSVTASGTSSDVTRALRLMAMPANAPTIASPRPDNSRPAAVEPSGYAAPFSRLLHSL
jgi:hypothetical protein